MEAKKNIWVEIEEMKNIITEIKRLIDGYNDKMKEHRGKSVNYKTE